MDDRQGQSVNKFISLLKMGGETRHLLRLYVVLRHRNVLQVIRPTI